MNPERYTAPNLDLPAFTCLFCTAFSEMRKSFLAVQSLTQGGLYHMISRCTACGQDSVWRGKPQYSASGHLISLSEPDLIYPNMSSAPMPNTDLPEEIAKTYLEARNVLSTSPRASAALLRLCIQQICVFKGLPGKNLNQDIGALVLQGLPERVQRALDAVRVIGNNAVHPGKLDEADTQEMAASLFDLVNLIVEELISRAKRIDSLYSRLPAGALSEIEKRDSTSKS